MEAKLMLAGDLKEGYKVVEWGGIAWTISKLTRTAHTVTLHLEPDEVASQLCLVRPQPCKRRLDKKTHVNAIATNGI